ncbi:hypothetical protein POVCU2_0069700 [Plasmodium ovale curtisi]|uniref:Uncharacterized protein n=1 Tax=Plasmodium ovale curtisi TaxID=864141 RepID=A0A1A8WIV3_PLAOA|nr:hypothetical protein POVCU2_0069700 [Plasmodium ovale curtisi]SBT00716.1 hypothetical protein POVCU1_061920 [Plasmodium ovale curtisi]
MCDRLGENLKTVDISISANYLDRITVNDLFDISSKFGIFGYAFRSFRGKKHTTEKYLTEEERDNLIENSENTSSCL